MGLFGVSEILHSQVPPSVRTFRVLRGSWDLQSNLASSKKFVCAPFAESFLHKTFQIWHCALLSLPLNVNSKFKPEPKVGMHPKVGIHKTWNF